MSNAPFVMLPAKPEAIRLADGRFAVFVGGAYQFTDRAGIARLRDLLDTLLRDDAAAAPATTASTDQTGDHA